MHVITVIPTLVGYEDECSLFSEVSRLVQSHQVLTQRVDERDSSDSHFEIRVAPYRGWHFARWVAREVRSLVNQASEGERIVVHEHFLSWSGLGSVARVRTLPVRRVLSLYSPTWRFLVEQRWRQANGVVVRAPAAFACKQVALHARNALLEAISVRVADGVHAVSPEILRDYWLAKPTLVKATPVDPYRWEPVKQQRSLPGIEMLFVGRVDYLKGLDLMLRSLAWIRERTSDPVRLTIVGPVGAAMESVITRTVAGMGLGGSVNLVGALPKSGLPRYYSRATALVLPSFHEGAPRVIKEALMCGCPVITSDIPGSHLEGSYRLLRLIQGRDPGAWGSELLRIYSSGPHTRETDGRHDREEVLRWYSPRAMAERLVCFYESLPWGSQTRVAGSS